jgi:hypothetical protein
MMICKSPWDEQEKDFFIWRHVGCLICFTGGTLTRRGLGVR